MLYLRVINWNLWETDPDPGGSKLKLRILGSGTLVDDIQSVASYKNLTVAVEIFKNIAYFDFENSLDSELDQFRQNAFKSNAMQLCHKVWISQFSLIFKTWWQNEKLIKFVKKLSYDEFFSLV